MGLAPGSPPDPSAQHLRRKTLRYHMLEEPHSDPHLFLLTTFFNPATRTIEIPAQRHVGPPLTFVDWTGSTAQSWQRRNMAGLVRRYNSILNHIILKYYARIYIPYFDFKRCTQSCPLLSWVCYRGVTIGSAGAHSHEEPTADNCAPTLGRGPLQYILETHRSRNTAANISQIVM